MVENELKDSQASVTVRMTFPLIEWEKWDASCKKDFGDVRWLKAMSDHKNNDADYNYRDGNCTHKTPNS